MLFCQDFFCLNNHLWQPKKQYQQSNLSYNFLPIFFLPDISGLDFIKTLKNQPAVIVTSAYPDYAVSSFDLDAIIDYLVKPFSFDRFLKATNKLKDRLKMAKMKYLKATMKSSF